MASVDIFVDNVSISLLRKQRDYLLELKTSDELEGLINLLDHMLDKAEGYTFE